MLADPALQRWLHACPSLEGDARTDAGHLARYVCAGEVLLAALPPKAARSDDEARGAAAIHVASRAVRRHFLSRHVEWLYDLLTENRTRELGLGELAYAAAEHCPGLVPTREQIADERTRLQVEKEGREIDQGLLFHALFTSPQIGARVAEAARRPTLRAQELIERFRHGGVLDLGSVLIERQGCAAQLTINNQSCLNAEDDRLVDDLETAIDLALLDDAVRVGVLRGGVMTHPRYAGRRLFSAGINLKALHRGQISFVDFLLRRELGFISKLIRGLVLPTDPAVAPAFAGVRGTIEKPWIAAVDGFAIGGGAQLLLVFDHVIAAADAYLSLPAAQEGIVPGFANLRLPRLVGSRIARQVILGGRKIWAGEPDARLLVDEVVDPRELGPAVDRQVRRLSAPAVIANRHMLNVAEEPLDLFLRYAAEFALVQAARLYSPDVLEKVTPA